MQNLNRVIGRRIRYLRIRNELTQTELAKLMGLKSSGIISQFENGERGLKKDSIFKAAEIFGVEPAVLLASADMSHEDLDMHVAFSKLLRYKKTDPKLKAYYVAIKKLLADQNSLQR